MYNYIDTFYRWHNQQISAGRIVTCQTEKIKSGTGILPVFTAWKAVPPYIGKEYIPLMATDV